jgi:hypothetical protein
LRAIAPGGSNLAKAADHAKEAVEVVEPRRHLVVQLEAAFDQSPIRPLCIFEAADRLVESVSNNRDKNGCRDGDDELHALKRVPRGFEHATIVAGRHHDSQRRGDSGSVGQTAVHLRVCLYGTASAVAGTVDDWYASREEAEAVLASIVRDEPELEGDVWVEAVEIEVVPN